MLTATAHQGTVVVSGFGRPFGLNTDEDSFLYVTDMDLHSVAKVSPNLTSYQYLNPKLALWQSLFEKLNYFDGPHSIAFDKNKNLYITTYYTPLIHVFDQQGKLLRTIGDKASRYPLAGPATAFISQDKLYVSEYVKNEIVCYTLQGDYITSFTGFDRPHMFKQGPDDYFYCADTWNHCIKKIHPNGEIKHSWSIQGLNNPFTPVSINFDSQRIIVSDWANHRINFFTLDGELIFFNNSLKLKHPYDAMMWRNRLVIADSHHSRVIVTEIFE